MRKIILKLSLIVISFIIIGCAPLSNFNHSGKYPLNQWTQIKPGISYQPLQIKKFHLNLIKINPNKFLFKTIQNLSANTAKPINQIHTEYHSVFSVNGSFFDKKFNPTGLIISDYQSIGKINPSNLSNGIFTINNKHVPYLYHSPIFANLSKKQRNNFEFAIQNGPILLNQNGKTSIKKDTGNFAARTAIGIDKDNNIIIIVIKQSIENLGNQLTLFKFAKLLQDNQIFHTLQLHSVLNLDGGPSTGFALNNFYLPELTPVQNIIITLPRPHEST